MTDNEWAAGYLDAKLEVKVTPDKKVIWLTAKGLPATIDRLHSALGGTVTKRRGHHLWIANEFAADVLRTVGESMTDPVRLKMLAALRARELLQKKSTDSVQFNALLAVIKALP
jgi:hypothetical protein